MRLNYYQGNIVHAKTDAIVNAANLKLLGGGGVDGAIHRAAGPELLAYCEKIPELEPNVRIRVGQARTTPGFNLNAKFIIHTAGPIFEGHQLEELRDGEVVSTDPAAALRMCVYNCLHEAKLKGIKTVAFPAISAGIFGGSVAEFARAIRDVKRFDEWVGIDEVVVVLFSDEDVQQFLCEE